MANKVKNRIGEKFGKLTVIALDRVVPGRGAYWLCRCECGTEKVIRGNCLTQGSTITCSCGRTVDLTGKRFGKLVALCPSGNDAYGRVIWHCRCDCGKEKDASSNALQSGNNVSCGCAHRHNLLGKMFGKLTVIEDMGNDHVGRGIWLCKCECGRRKVIQAHRLTAGVSQSCNCLSAQAKRQSFTTHGMTKTRIYACWKGIWSRCVDTNNISYKNYGGKGIVVDERWGDFETFFADMGDIPEGMSIDRIDSDGPYSKENCRWADKKTQTRNRKNSRMVTYNGETRCVADWADIYKLPNKTVYRRLYILNWLVHDALTIPLGGKRSCVSKRSDDYKNRARRAVARAIKRGVLVRPEHCQKPGCENHLVEAHHHLGYDKEHQLDVMWLCKRHHPTSNELLITYDGQTLSFREWSEITGVPARVIRNRYYLAHGVVSEGLFAPVPHIKGKLLTLDDETHNLSEWSKIRAISISTIIKRIKRGLSVEEILRPINR